MSKNMDMAILLDVYGGMLTEKQSDTLGLYYNEDLSLTEIAENTGITRQGVHKCIRNAEEYLLQLEETLGFARHYKQLSEITKRLELLSEASYDTALSAEIKSCVEELKNI